MDFIPKIEAIVIEINLKTRKWLLFGIYNPHKESIVNHLESIGKQLNVLCEKYDNFILIGDFNSEICEDAMQEFCSTYNLKNLVKEKTCFKSRRVLTSFLQTVLFVFKILQYLILAYLIFISYL